MTSPNEPIVVEFVEHRYTEYTRVLSAHDKCFFTPSLSPQHQQQPLPPRSVIIAARRTKERKNERWR